MSPSDEPQDNGHDDSIPLSLALSIMDSFSKAGVVLVPSDPTEEMLEAGAGVCGGDGEKAKAVYVAMISAAG